MISEKNRQSHDEADLESLSNRSSLLEHTPNDDRSTKHILPFLLLLVFILPILVYWVHFHWIVRISPYLEWYDPEFAFLMNSLEVFKGHPYGFLDHPGTPVEIIGTVIYALIYPFLGKSPHDFILYNLQNPGLFLYIAHAFLVVANIACVVFFFVVVNPARRLAAVLTASSLATLYFVLHPMSFLATSTWSHNSFAFPFGTLLLLIVFKYLTREPFEPLSTRKLVALGIGAGVFTAITIYLATWVLGILLAIGISYSIAHCSWKARLRAVLAFGLSSLAGFFLAILPAWPRAGYFFEFLRVILSDSKRPGGGAFIPNLISFSQDFTALAVLAGVLIGLVIVGSILWVRDRGRNPGLWGLAGGLTLQLLLLTAGILQSRYGNRFYFLAVAAIVPVLALTVLRIFAKQAALSWMLSAALILFVVIELPISVSNQIADHDKLAKYIDRIVAEETRAVQQYTQQEPASAGPVIVYSFGTYSPCVALWHGNSFTSEAFGPELSEICPNQYFYFRDNMHQGPAYDFRTYEVRTPQGPVAADRTDWNIFIGCQEFLSSPLLKGRVTLVNKSPRWLGACPASRKGEPLIIAYRK